MPSANEKQREAMAIAEHHPEQLYSRNKGMAKMSHKQLHEFASSVKKYDDGGVVGTLSPGDEGTGAGVRAHQVALMEVQGEDNLAPHTAPDKVTSPYADTKGSKVLHQHKPPKGEKPTYNMAQDILKNVKVHDNGGVVKVESVKDEPAIKTVKQKPVEQKVEMGKPASRLPELPPAVKPTPKAPLYDKGGKVNVFDGKHQLAILKEGERVLTEKQNKEYEKEHGMGVDCYDKGGKVGSIYDVLKDKGAKGPKKEIKSMTHTKTHNGKHVITHKHHAPFDGPEHDETHMHGSMADVHKHMDTHNAEPAEGAAAPEAPQMTASPSPAPPMGAAGPGAGAPPAMPGM